MFPPERIVCLTEETVETLYLLGEDRRIVGVSGYAVRPPQVRREKPRVSAFISADVPKILALKPDLVLTFSDLQADIVAELIRNNVAVHAFNQRDVAGIFDMIRTLGALVGAARKSRSAGQFAGRAHQRCARACTATAAPAARLFRGMGRADDFRHCLGIGADRGRRRHRGISAARRAQECQGPHRVGRGRDRRAAGHHCRLLVRQEIRTGQGRRTPRLCPSSRRAPAAGCARSNPH